MGKQQLVEKSVYTNLVGDVENTILTNQLNIQYDNIQVVKTKIIYRGITISVNEETFKTAVNNEEGNYFFGHYEEDGEDKWFLDEGDNTVDLSDYGITLSGGNPYDKDTIAIHYIDGEITYEYAEHTILFADNINTFDFISFVSDKVLGIAVNEDENGSRFLDIWANKFELSLGWAMTFFQIDVWNTEKTDVEVTLILAKKVEE